MPGVCVTPSTNTFETVSVPYNVIFTVVPGPFSESVPESAITFVVGVPTVPKVRVAVAIPEPLSAMVTFVPRDPSTSP